MASVLEPDGRATGRVIRAVGGSAEAAARQRELLEQAQRDAQEIVAQAHAQADAIRQQAAQEGLAAGLAAAETTLADRGDEPIARHAAVLRNLTCQIEQQRDEWLRQWEQAIMPLAAAIAGRMVRREVRQHPDIVVELVRESLELACSGGRIRIALHPDDLAIVEADLQGMIERLGRRADIELAGDESIVGGGCLVTTEHGQIDQRFTTQLRRITEELD